jgi:hypothetical protein
MDVQHFSALRGQQHNIFRVPWFLDSRLEKLFDGLREALAHMSTGKGQEKNKVHFAECNLTLFLDEHCSRLSVLTTVLSCSHMGMFPCPTCLFKLLVVQARSIFAFPRQRA